MKKTDKMAKFKGLRGDNLGVYVRLDRGFSHQKHFNRLFLKVLMVSGQALDRTLSLLLTLLNNAIQPFLDIPIHLLKMFRRHLPKLTDVLH